MNTNDVTELEPLDVDELSPTNPDVQVSVLPRLDNPEDDLEKRLAWLAEEVRSTSAEHAKKKRSETVLEAREYKTALVPATTQPPNDIDLPKVTLAAGVDPQRDPTLVGRRVSEIEWDFDISEPEELSRTMPLDPHAAVADPLPFHAPARARAPARHRTLVVALGTLGGILLGAFLHQSLARYSSESSYANLPPAKRGVGDAAQEAERSYLDWATTRVLLAPDTVAETQNADPRPMPTSSAASVPSVAGSLFFRWVKPIPSAIPKPVGSAGIHVPAQEKLRSPIYTDTMGF